MNIALRLAEIDRELARLRHEFDVVDASSGGSTALISKRIADLERTRAYLTHGRRHGTTPGQGAPLFAQLRQHVDKIEPWRSAEKVVEALLEGTQDFKREFLGAASWRDLAIAKAPDDAQTYLEHAPDDFLQAFSAGLPANWDPQDDNFSTDEHWPEYIDDSNWSFYTVDTKLATENGQLLVAPAITYCGGDAADEDFVPWGSEDHAVYRQDYSWARYYNLMAEYYDWVAEHGDDPLDFIQPPPVKDRVLKWLVGVRDEGGRPKFVSCRQINKVKPSPKAVKDHTKLPENVREYLTLDDAGMLDIATADLLKVPEFTEQRSDGLIVLTFELTEKEEQDVRETLVWYREKATKFAQEARNMLASGVGGSAIW